MDNNNIDDVWKGEVTNGWFVPICLSAEQIKEIRNYKKIPINA